MAENHKGLYSIGWFDGYRLFPAGHGHVHAGVDNETE